MKLTEAGWGPASLATGRLYKLKSRLLTRPFHAVAAKLRIERAVHGSGLLVAGDVAVDEAGDVVVLLLLFLEERVLGGIIFFDLDIVVRDRGDFFLSRVDVFERDFTSALDRRLPVRRGLLLLGLQPAARAPSRLGTLCRISDK